MYGTSLLFLKRNVVIQYFQNYSNKKLMEVLVKMSSVDKTKFKKMPKKNTSPASPSNIYLQVLGSGARGAPTALYIFTDSKRYLFNCGEGTQRICQEHGAKISSLENIFITSKSWKNLGGLLGLSLTLQEFKLRNITLHGPEGMDEIYEATKRFAILKDMNVTMANCSPSADYSDGVITVKYVLLGPLDDLLKKDPVPVVKKPKNDNPLDKNFEEFLNDNTYYYKGSEYKNMIEKTPPPTNIKNKDAVKKKTEKVLHDLQKKSNCTVAYICSFEKRLGTLDLTKCVEKGIKPGPQLGLLKKGEDVVLPDGTLVLSKDVKTPDLPGPVFIVLEVPDISYLKENEFAAHFDNGSNPKENVPQVVVHFTPPHVIHHPVYKSFMEKFGPTASHLILNSQNSCLGSEAVHRTQHMLHVLDPDIFPLLKDVSIPAVWTNDRHQTKTNSPKKMKAMEELKNKIALAQFQSIVNTESHSEPDYTSTLMNESGAASKLDIIAASTLTMVHLKPNKNIDRSLEPKLRIQDYIKEPMSVEGFEQSLHKFREVVDNVRYTKSDLQKEYPKVVFLGTGSAIPSKHRNTSGIVVHFSEQKAMVLDCGEGTLNQMVRFYGPKKINSFLRSLTAIYVSHLHADHHMGLIGLLLARREAFEELSLSANEPIPPLYLIAPGQIISWLHYYDKQFQPISDIYSLIPCQCLIDNSRKNVVTPAILSAIGVENIDACFVVHCANAFGVALTIDGQHKITYSGDTMPCDDLVAIGVNSTLLIHEATIEDELSIDARFKRHSTISQAIHIGWRMNAKHTVLTHFSQRYSRLPRFSANVLNDSKNVGIAFDNMQVTMGDLELLPHMYGPLHLIFADFCVELEMKAQKRARAIERHGDDGSRSLDNKSHKGSPTRKNIKEKTVTDCRQSPSLPTPNKARYRESHASRLRQELKGMTVSGFVKVPRSRSVSPTKLNRQSSALTSSAVPRRTLSNCSHTLKKYRNRTKSPCSDASSNSVACTVSIHSLDKYRTKTKNAPATKDNPKESVITGSPSESGIGYGKPMLQLLDQKISIRKDRSPSQHPAAEKIINDITKRKPSPESRKMPRNKSPTGSWKEKSRVMPSIINRDYMAYKTRSYAYTDVLTSILFHMVYWRLMYIASSSWVSSWIYLTVIIVAAILFWTAAKSPAAAQKTSLDYASSNVKEIRNAMWKGSAPSKCLQSSSALQKKSLSKSPPRQMFSVDRRPDATDQRLTQSGQQQNKTLINQKNLKNWNLEIPKNDFKEKLKQMKPNLNMGKPNTTVYSQRSYKPQLEDIKSSILFINKKQKREAGSHDLPILKPKPIVESERKISLSKAKEKYTTKQFWKESKYDKIEGLNWISWR